MTRYDTEFLSYGTHVGTDSRQRSISLYEQMAWVKDKHTVKFGFSYYKATTVASIATTVLAR